MKINQDTLKTIEKLLHSERHIEVINKYSAIDFESKGINANISSLFHKLIAASFNATGQKKEALKRYLLAESLNQQDSEIKSNIAGIYFDIDEYLQAEEYYEKALNIHPKNANILLNKGVLLQHLKRFQEALNLYDKAIENSPRFVRAINNKAAILDHIGQYELAEATYKKALLIESKNIEVLNNLGSINRKRNPVEALNYYEKVLKIDAKNIIVNFNKANVLQDMGDYDEAVKFYEKCKNDGLDVSGLYVGLATTYQHKGQHDLAFENYKKALAKEPENLKILSGLIFGINHNDNIHPNILKQYYKRYDELLKIKFSHEIHRHNRTNGVKHKLKIGFVSADFWNHAIMFFIRGIIEALSNYDDLELYGYYNNSINDFATMRLMSYFKAWREIETLDDVSVKHLIVKDEIDILIDLSGHTSGERLAVFAMKAAPIQMSWAGFPGSTGLSSIDYYIADENFFPNSSCADQFTEAIVKIPYVNFEPPANLPIIKKLPALEKGYVTFGSFNRTNKISRDCVNLWAKILKNSKSRFVIGGLPPKLKINQIKQWFEEEGVDNALIDYHSVMPLRELMELINNEVDICLDSFPYGGGTTSWLMLTAGVPTITLQGKLPVSRQGASILKWLNLEEYIALSEDEYYLIATAIEKDLEKLNHIRLNLRSNFNSSNVSKPKLAAASLVSLFRKASTEFHSNNEKELVVDVAEAKSIYKVNNLKRLMFAQYRSGNLNACIRTADKILEYESHNLTALKLKGSIALYHGDYEKGTSILSASIDFLDEEAINNLIVGFQKMGLNDVAKKLLRKTISQNVDFSNLKMTYLGLVDLEEMDFYPLSETLNLIKNLDQFRILYERLYQYDSFRSDLYANALFKKAEDFQLFVDFDYYRHTILLFRIAKYDEALEAINKIHEESIYKNIALLLYKIKTHDEDGMNDLFSNLSSLNYLHPHLGKALIEYCIYKNDLNSAKEFTDIYSNNIDNNFEFKLLRVDIYLLLRKFNDALKELLELINENKHANVYEKLGLIFNLMRMNDKAIAYLDSSLKLNPYKLSTWQLKLNVARSINDPRMIEEFFEKISYLSMDPVDLTRI